MKKYLLVVLTLLTLANLFLLTACSSIPRNTTSSQPVLSPTTNSDTGSSTNLTNGSQNFENDPITFGVFVDSLNNHQVGTLLDLFHEQATLTQIDQFNLGSTLPQDDWTHVYTGKSDIQGWLEYQSGAIVEIMPQEYRVSANSVTLYALFYYPNQIEDVRMDAQIQGGKFEAFYFYIEKISYN